MAKKDEWLGDVQLDADADEGEGEDDGQDWGDWNADQEEEGDDLDSNILCLFCCSIFNSSSALFHHCRSIHYFDFRAITKTLALDFYASFKLINYVRSQVAENICWSCRHTCQSKQDLQNHLHETFSLEDTIFPWADDKYLKPFMQEDPLLYSFGEYYESEDEDTTAKIAVSSHGKSKDKHWEICSAKAAVTNEIKNVNKNYFGSYSSFAIHREMISDKVRTDAYRQAILNNPSLLHGAAVLDVGCGTGILSLFAAQAGASSVIAVEASEKMASVATEIAKNNGLLWSGSPNNRISQCTGVIRVVQGMVEELDNSIDIQPHSIDVLLSEWMGYCLLYESMLSSVLFVRDRWLKPGGAIIPDTATMFVAGFGRGGTSIPFWENVYGFNMSCIGKELVEDAAGVPFVDVVDSQDIVTNTVVLQSFDLLKMIPDEMDFSSRIELEPQLDNPTNCTRDSFSKTTWCYGVVLWFETGFTSRFCKEMPIVLSTSPYAPKTHWSQTILTFKEPIAIASALAKLDFDRLAAVGTESCPAVKIHSRISIARAASQHRCIDISLEIAVIGPDGLKRSWPAQIFNLA
ncbi:protein arginine methyltransferase 3 [Actinidia rufa]|uniref:type I protein arginine methyltransferase n=1 Tax=Actinidia rufa TaxID=165716 RepID=A0A7J0DND0_9ERIC|nr:protein arginine methyltransferase 3 [Actinidia rufa]